MALALLSVVFLFGCQKAYYSTMESMGYDKREILADRVEKRPRVPAGGQRAVSLRPLNVSSPW